MANKYFLCENFKKHDPPCSFSLLEDERIIVDNAEVHEVKMHGETSGPTLRAAIEASLLDPPAPLGS